MSSLSNLESLQLMEVVESQALGIASVEGVAFLGVDRTMGDFPGTC